LLVDSPLSGTIHAKTVEGKRIDPATNVSLYHRMTVFSPFFISYLSRW